MRTVFILLPLAAALTAAAPSFAEPLTPYANPGGKFHVLLPGTPHETVEKYGEGAQAVDIHRLVKADSNVIYTVSYNDAPAEQVKLLGEENIFTEFKAGFLRSSKGKITKDGPFTLGGLHGEEIHFIGGQGRKAVQRLAMVGNRMYAWGVVQIFGAEPGAEEWKFLDSFRVDGVGAPKGAPGARSAAAHAAKSSPAAARTPAAQGWRELRVAPANFRVSMPGSATSFNKKLAVRDSSGVQGVIHFHSCAMSAPSRELYLIAYADGAVLKPGDDPQDCLDQARDQFQLKERGQLTSSKDIQINGAPGREFHYVTTDGFSQFCRLLVTEQRVYIVMALVPTDQSYSERMTRFFDSFKLLK